VPPTVGAVKSGVYRNMFVEAGYSTTAVDAKVAAAYAQLYDGDPATQKIFYEVAEEKSAYVTDVKNHDVRTEGMGYGMMVQIQLDHQDRFDELWTFVKLHMFHADPSDPLFGWSAWHAARVPPYAPIDDGPAPDGETWFITTLYFAAARWGDATGRFNYTQEADVIISAVTTKVDPQGMFTPPPGNIVRFDPGTPFTDPSYLLPAFYEVWALKSKCTPARWIAAANSSRNTLVGSVNAQTGLSPNTCDFNGGPGGFSDLFEDDTCRTARNCSLDFSWIAVDPRQIVLSNTIHTFFAGPGGGIGKYGDHYTLEGVEMRDNYSPGLAAVNAVASLAANSSLCWDFIDALWEMPIPSGTSRTMTGTSAAACTSRPSSCCRANTAPGCRWGSGHLSRAVHGS